MNIPRQPRPARPAPVAVNVLKTLVQVAVFWGFFLWLLPTIIVHVENTLGIPRFELSPWVGWTVFGLASVLGFSSGMIFAIWGAGTPLPLDTAAKFVILGPYRFIRNPMATAGIAQGFAVGLILNSWSVLAYSLMGALVWHFLARPWEEADLKVRFGQPYVDYMKSVPLWYPRMRPYSPTTSPNERIPTPDSSAQTGRATQDDETPA